MAKSLPLLDKASPAKTRGGGKASGRLPVSPAAFRGCPKLPAGSVNVTAARSSDRRRNAGLEDDVAEGLDPVLVGTFIGSSGPGIERNQIHLGRELVLADQSNELACMIVAVVLVLEHHIFERDPPRVVRARVGRTGLEQLLDPVLAIEWHDLVADLLRDRVERDGEIDPDLLARACHHRNDPARRKRDAPPGQTETVSVHDDL